jgi:hypothetical protein
MFHLWIGVMAGILLAYLWMRAHAPRRRAPWQSWRWWLAGFVALIIIIPVIWELLRTAFGSLGLLEAFKAVLLPWAAGVGFGIWIYLAIGPLPRAPTGKTDEVATAIRQDLSFIPIAVALLFVTVIVSDQQYGWLSRLQRLTISGGGVEFAPRSSGPPQQPNYAPAPPGLKQTGEGRVSQLLGFMSLMTQTICRDIKYAADVGYKFSSTAVDCPIFPPEEFKEDLSFAQKVGVPLGKHLRVIHRARSYDNIGFLIDRAFVDSFRSFILYHRDGVPETERRQLAKEVHDHILALWAQVCQTERRLYQLRATDPKDEDLVNSCTNDLTVGEKFLDLWLSPERKGIALNRALPYGTLLAAKLLNAAGEVQSAVRDLDEWIDANQPDGNHPDQFYKRFGVYRTLVESTLLLMGDPDLSDAKAYIVVEHSRRLLEIGKKLLSSTHPSDGSRLSWRAQRSRIEKKDGIDPMWEIGICANDLTDEFKIFMASYLSASNNLAYFLDRNIEFAEREGLLNDMEQQAKFLAKKINMRCLDDRTSADQAQAEFLDTATAVELTLARRTKNRAEKRSHLCDARKYAKGAVRLQESTISRHSVSPPDSEQTLDRAEAMKRWTLRLQENDQFADLVSYLRRVDDVEQQLVYENMDGDC